MNALDADLCAVTGDLVDGPVARVAAEVAPLGALRARDGVFFVTGNHDHYSGADAWVAEVERLGLDGPAQPQRRARSTASALCARWRRRSARRSARVRSRKSRATCP